MRKREYQGVCGAGHRSYHRLELIDWTKWRQVLVLCTKCGQPARIEPLAAALEKETPEKETPQ